MEIKVLFGCRLWIFNCCVSVKIVDVNVPGFISNFFQIYKANKMDILILKNVIKGLKV